MKGCVFNIQHFSIHDGPGIRTIVFLKGCPLRCAWCANPESQDPKPQIGYNPKNCIGWECLMCQRVCKDQAIFYPGFGGVEINFDKCSGCMKCAAYCPSKAVSAYGEYKTVETIIDQVEEDLRFYDASHGGLTLSGGEPTMQYEFAYALLKEAKNRRIHTAIETCGYSPWEMFSQIIKLTDYVLFDIKTMNDEKHYQYTAVHNQLILENFQRLKERYPEKPVKVRTPVIPNVNDTEEDIRNIRDYIMKYPLVEYELLKYHRYGVVKYDYLGKTYQLDEMDLGDEKFNQLKLIASGKTV